ncbi:cupin domain-containing protein [Desulfoluna spongiiphila]|uniref:Cupin domain-containing protein n=1 Tax=Desulfoluna spongiiphila TaxID=419481 RepID=A0A1G5HH16_9BACT|nr:cupin domain-containing protein [Desulfoluna spongiiphila]SCY63004.1 Cupin domain-containing protein [Desulfoluna spongiiphila]VVS93417.1 rmlc-like jelly roll fold [Desulfoluna spongiiphila]
MSSVFPEPITSLPIAHMPQPGATAYLSQAETHQLLFMQFDQDLELPEHAHAAQVGFVLEGTIDLVVDGQAYRFTKGDRYYIPAGSPHSGKIHAGYADISFFEEPSRYAVKA